jgi:hypothetical protein
MNSKLSSFLAVASAAFFISCAPVAAQWQVPEHSIAIGRGTGTGFNSVAPGPNGSMLQSQGTSSDPAYTTFPLAMLGLCGTEFSFPVYYEGAWQCSTSSAPLAAVLNGTLNLNPLAASTQPGLNVTTSGPNSGPIPGTFNTNLVQGSFNAPLTGPGDPGTGECACWGLFQVSATTGPNFDGVESYGLSVGNVTSGPNTSWTDVVGKSSGFSNNFAWPNSRGYGAVSSAVVGLSGTNAQISGHEFGVRLDTATGVPIRYGINVDNYGPHTATGMDTAISIMGGAAGGSWKNGIVFTNPGGTLAPALASTGNLMASEVDLTVDSIFDFHNITASSWILNAPFIKMSRDALALGTSAHLGGFSLAGPASTPVQATIVSNGTSIWTYGSTTLNDYVVNDPQNSRAPLTIAKTNGLTTIANGLTVSGTVTLGGFTFALAGNTSLPAIAQGDLWYGSATGAISALAKSTSSSQYLKNSGTSNNPAWASITPADVGSLGSGVATALGVNIGSAGAPVLFNGAGGTPSSIALTNGTGLPVSGITPSTGTALGVGSLEVGNASDTTISRVSAGVIAVEGVTVPTQTGGTWTPALTFATPGNLSVSYLAQYGTYLKIGRLVDVSFNILTNSFTQTTASGNLQITGLPFTSANDGISPWRGALQFEGITKAGYTNFAAGPVPNSTAIGVHASGSGVGFSSVAAADVPSGGTVRLQGSVTYWTD